MYGLDHCIMLVLVLLCCGVMTCRHHLQLVVNCQHSPRQECCKHYKTYMHSPAFLLTPYSPFTILITLPSLNKACFYHNHYFIMFNSNRSTFEVKEGIRYRNGARRRKQSDKTSRSRRCGQ